MVLTGVCFQLGRPGKWRLVALLFLEKSPTDPCPCSTLLSPANKFCSASNSRLEIIPPTAASMLYPSRVVMLPLKGQGLSFLLPSSSTLNLMTFKVLGVKTH